MSEREIFVDLLGNLTAALREWLATEGHPFTPEQEALIADLVAGKNWRGGAA